MLVGVSDRIARLVLVMVARAFHCSMFAGDVLESASVGDILRGVFCSKDMALVSHLSFDDVKALTLDQFRRLG